MPDYRSPGVYVEEVRFRAPPIEGVSTCTAAFIGPARTGPCHAPGAEPPSLITSFNAFERLHGGLADLSAGEGESAINHIAHAAYAFFQQGGARLYVVRLASPGMAVASVGAVDDGDTGLGFVARFPGKAGNGQVTLREHASPAAANELDAAPPGSVVRATLQGRQALLVNTDGAWRLADTAIDRADVRAGAPRLITVSAHAIDGDGRHQVHERMGLHPAHPRWIGGVMAARPLVRDDRLYQPYAIHIGTNLSAAGLLAGLFEHARTNAAGEPETLWTLDGGQDGGTPTPPMYESAITSLAGLDDVSILAAPGSSDRVDEEQAAEVARALIAHAAAPRAWCIAVLDTPPGQTPTEARTWRTRFDSTHAALYFPWVEVAHPLANPERGDIPATLTLPPSGFVCGIYARNDMERGVHHAPANEVVTGALRFERQVSKVEQELLNPAGVNCLRSFERRGHRVWGARLVSSDPGWQYVNQRRYFNYLEASLSRGTQWVAFEPQGERLWANVRESLTNFLHNEWRAGGLRGSTQDQAFFVRCDRSTMTQDDIDHGRLVCLIGLAMIQPAEFTIFRLRQRTAGASA